MRREKQMGTKSRKAVRFLALAMAVLLFVPVYAAGADEPITSKEQLNQAGMKVGVGTGSASMLIAEKELPNAEIV